MHSRSRHSRRDPGREIAIGDEPDARTRLANVADQLLMSWPVQYDHHEIIHAALEPPRNGLQILLHGRIEIHGAFRCRTHNDLLHVAIGSVEQSTMLGSREHRDRSRPAGRAEIRAFQWIYGDIDR